MIQLIFYLIPMKKTNAIMQQYPPDIRDKLCKGMNAFAHGDVVSILRALM